MQCGVRRIYSHLMRQCLIILVTWRLLWPFSFCWDQTLTVNGLLTSTGWAGKQTHTRSHILHLHRNTYTLYTRFQFIIWLIFWLPHNLTHTHTHTHPYNLKIHTVWSHISFDYGNVCRGMPVSSHYLWAKQRVDVKCTNRQTPSPTHTHKHVAKWQSAAFLLVPLTHLINWLLYVSGRLERICLCLCLYVIQYVHWQ